MKNFKIKGLIVSLLMTTSLSAFAGYDFTVGPLEVSLKTSDGQAVPGVTFSYDVFTQHNDFPCPGDFGGTLNFCWRAKIVDSGRFVLDADGTASFPAKHFASTSNRDKPSDKALSMGDIEASVPFQDQNGNTFKCDAIQGSWLQQEGINLTYPDLTQSGAFVIGATKAQLDQFIQKMIGYCQANLARINAQNPNMPPLAVGSLIQP